MRPFDLSDVAARAMAVGVITGLPASLAEAAAPTGTSLKGAWTITTTPPISVQQARGKKAATVMPIEVVIRV